MMFDFISRLYDLREDLLDGINRRGGELFDLRFEHPLAELTARPEHSADLLRVISIKGKTSHDGIDIGSPFTRHSVASEERLKDAALCSRFCLRDKFSI